MRAKYAKPSQAALHKNQQPTTTTSDVHLGCERVFDAAGRFTTRCQIAVAQSIIEPKSNLGSEESERERESKAVKKENRF